jgi:hypothetical protein
VAISQSARRVTISEKAGRVAISQGAGRVAIASEAILSFKMPSLAVDMGRRAMGRVAEGQLCVTRVATRCCFLCFYFYYRPHS